MYGFAAHCRMIPTGTFPSFWRSSILKFTRMSLRRIN
uniref:Uncharacterized protein n=1 Tax=Lepeophtheirus salmonis TaxID=72036 RepID=A0A0K2V6D9_LEPSM